MKKLMMPIMVLGLTVLAANRTGLSFNNISVRTPTPAQRTNRARNARIGKTAVL